MDINDLKKYLVRNIRNLGYDDILDKECINIDCYVRRNHSIFPAKIVMKASEYVPDGYARMLIVHENDLTSEQRTKIFNSGIERIIELRFAEMIGGEKLVNGQDKNSSV